MPVGIFLLGPDQWDGARPPSIPGGQVDPTPHELRVSLARLIEVDSGGQAMGVVMDPQAQDGGEDDVAFFERLEAIHRTEHYFVIMPRECKVLGTVFEGGMLVRDFKWGGHPKLTLFMQTGIAQRSADGMYDFQEQGRRTRYLTSLATRAHNVVEWETIQDLRVRVTKQARAIWGP